MNAFRLFVTGSVGIAIFLSGLSLHELQANRSNELHNRVTNVHTWCTAINEGRREGLRLHGHEAAYRIKLLDCGALEAKTERSAGESHG